MKVCICDFITIWIEINTIHQIEIEREKLLSNFEVNQHLVEIQQQNNWLQDSKKKKAWNPSLELVTKDVTSYLEKSPVAIQNVENIVQAMKDLSKFSLEKIEKLQIKNSAPYSLVNLYAIVEECDQRFNEQEIEEILGIVQTHFPQQEEEGEFEAEEEEVEVVVQDEDQVMEE